MIDVGLMFAFRNPAAWAVPIDDVYRTELRLIESAEALGYDSIWLTEHHFADDAYSPALVPLAAAVASRTERVRIGTNLLLLPLYHPVRLAEDIAVLDIISGGRIDVGVGQGYVEQEFAGFGIPKSERTGRFVESLAVLKAVWSEDECHHAGRYFQVDGVRLQPRPLQRPHPPLWIGATAPGAVDRAGRLGANLLGLASRRLQAVYEQGLLAGGWDPAERSVLQLLWVYVAPSDDEAWEVAAPHFHHVLDTYARWAAQSGDAGRMNSALDVPPVSELRRTDPKRLMFPPIFGSPETVGAAIESRLSQVRTTHICLAMRLPGMSEELCYSSMKLFADEVAPRLRAGAISPAAATRASTN
jgi:alkanesulfonate monooxygenase SsuD/methylene tetrahydromethanopterin reductase-like flavin-dependent oxidoreductase (luciferase family)